ncbi:MAG: tripartite tricarboxylate transporter TctB family protein [Nocardioides sp.]|nr:tripartite tricarboxylate transporter TctB family protein [Nocardioides sp.]
MTMSDERTPASDQDILAEIQAEVAHDLEEERPPSGGPTYQVIGALVALVVGIGGAVLSYGYGMGSLRQPGAGMWPFVVSVAIALMAAALLVVGRGLNDSEKFTRSSVLPAVGLVTFIVLAMLMPVIGFEIPSLLLCVVWLRFLGGETWRSTIITAGATVAAFYFLFLYGLRIPLPHLF